ncbi:MAG: HDOD domain-containing protein [Azonexus sp.]
MISTATILADVKRLPTLPASLARLSALQHDERSSAADYEKVIGIDPALTVNVLRLANSGFFGSPRQIVSVRQAVTLLGTQRIVEAAMGAAFSAVLPNALPGYGIESVTFWRHCVAVGVLTQRIGEDLRLEHRADGFTCGLLHDIGKLVTSAYLAPESTAIFDCIRERHKCLIAAEREIIGTDHTQIGAAVAEKWALPDRLCSVVRWHHSPSLREVPRAPAAAADLVDAVHVADCLAHVFGFGTDIGELARELDAGAVERIGEPVRRLERIVGEAANQIEELSAVFGAMRGGS